MLTKKKMGTQSLDIHLFGLYLMSYMSYSIDILNQNDHDVCRLYSCYTVVLIQINKYLFRIGYASNL